MVLGLFGDRHNDDRRPMGPIAFRPPPARIVMSSRSPAIRRISSTAAPQPAAAPPRQASITPVGQAATNKDFGFQDNRPDGCQCLKCRGHGKAPDPFVRSSTVTPFPDFPGPSRHGESCAGEWHGDWRRHRLRDRAGAGNLQVFSGVESGPTRRAQPSPAGTTMPASADSDRAMIPAQRGRGDFHSRRDGDGGTDEKHQSECHGVRRRSTTMIRRQA